MTAVHRARELTPADVVTSSEAEGVSLDAQPAVLLTMQRASSGAGAPDGSGAVIRAMRERDDAAVASRAASMLAALASPEAVLMLAQGMMREIRTSQRSEDARVSADRSEVALEQRITADRAAREADARRGSDQDIAMAFQVVGASLAVAAGAVSAVFTGGAGLVAAIGVAIAVLGPLVCNLLARAGALDAGVAAAIGGGCALVGACMSFGAGAAAGAAGVIPAAVNAGITVAQSASAAAQAAQGGFEIAASLENGSAMQSRADAALAGATHERELEEMQDATESFGEIMRLFGRIARSIQATQEARGECLRAAAGARG